MNPRARMGTDATTEAPCRRPSRPALSAITGISHSYAYSLGRHSPGPSNSMCGQYPIPSYCSRKFFGQTVLPIGKVSIRAPVRTPGRPRSALPVRPQDVTSPLPRTCQSTSDRPRLICQRTGETDLFCSAFRTARNMGGQAGTGGSRKGVHKINGSVRSTGLATP